MKPYTYVCMTCGSNDVSLEGFIRWDVVAQKYEVSDLCDKGHYCNQCDGECYVEQVYLPADRDASLELLRENALEFTDHWGADEDDDERKQARITNARIEYAYTLVKEDKSK